MVLFGFWALGLYILNDSEDKSGFWFSLWFIVCNTCIYMAHFGLWTNRKEFSKFIREF